MSTDIINELIKQRENAEKLLAWTTLSQAIEGMTKEEFEEVYREYKLKEKA